eukprot:EG_transcript_52717
MCALPVRDSPLLRKGSRTQLSAEPQNNKIPLCAADKQLQATCSALKHAFKVHSNQFKFIAFKFTAFKFRRMLVTVLRSRLGCLRESSDFVRGREGVQDAFEANLREGVLKNELE